MKTYYRLLGVSLVAVTTINFVWFALTFWAYLTTKSVISTSGIAGVWLIAMALSANLFGSIVDRYKKKLAMLGSAIATLVLFGSGLALLRLSPESAFATIASVRFWVFSVVLLLGVVAGSMYNIAIPTLVAFLVPEDKRDRANGLFGTVMGVSFAVTSVTSGFALGRVFGLAHAIEQAASPITAFFIGPIAQFVFIPFMTTGRGVDWLGGWFGTGTGRGLALVFILAGCIGLVVTLIAMRSRPYRLLAARYRESGPKPLSKKGGPHGERNSPTI